MARGDDTAEEVERGAGRILRTGVFTLIALGVIGAWFYADGWYVLEPGEAAVVLQLGKYDRTVVTSGIHFKVPRPFESVETLAYGELRREKFGFYSSGDPAVEDSGTADTAIQTEDNNVVNLSYVVQYRVRDAFSFVYGMAHATSTLRDAAQAAMRSVIGGRTVSEVLSTDRAGIERDAKAQLQTMLDAYFPAAESSAYEVSRVQLQDVQPPAQVQDAFEDVVSATQDEQRARSEAEGDAREIVERANAEAQELREQATAYKDAKLVEAGGEAKRFEALLVEYKRAPKVTRERLYLETMEVILPGVDKVIVEPDAVSLMPFFPAQGGGNAAGPSPTGRAAAGAALSAAADAGGDQ